MNKTERIRSILILYNKEIYKEIDLDDYEDEIVMIGNTSECQIKLKTLYEKDFNVIFTKKKNLWQISDGKDSYCVINAVKVPRRIMSSGDKITIKDVVSKNEIFKINYFLDFTIETEDYDREINIESIKKIKIGSDNSNNIIITEDIIDKNHAEIVRSNGEDSIVDLNSKFGVYINGKKIEKRHNLNEDDFIIICGYKILYRKNKIMLSRYNENIKINGLQVFENDNVTPFNYPCFYRSPRLLQDISQDDILIEEPPAKANAPTNNLLITMIPLVGTIIFTSMMAGGGEGKNMIYSVGMVALTGFVAVLAYVMELVKSKKQQFKRYKRYKDYVKDKETQIIDKRKLLMESIRNNNPDTEECIEFLETFNRRLWERVPEHEDFLNVSLGRGIGDLTFDIKVEDEKLEIDKDSLKRDPRKLKDVYGEMEDVPICIKLTEEYPIGIYGDRLPTIEILKNIIIKISTLHYFEDVKIAAIYPKEEEEKWKWLKWIPHIWTNKREFRYIGNTKESAHNVLNVLYDEIKNRKNNEEYKKNSYLPIYIIIIADRHLCENEPIMEMLESGENYGVVGMFVYEDLALIPKESKKIIEVNNNEATYRDVKNSNKFKIISFNNLENDICESFSRKMSPIFVKSSFTQGALTSYYTLFDMYNIRSETELNILERWNKNKVYETMEVPLGVRAGDEIVYLNLHEKFHGPHGLVAGTTGSGKSEIIQTYIASLAINYHPYDINIIIIDYKGGGMANQFKNLPHLVGTITNLDGNQINRSLISIKSELKRRQKIFGEYNVNHIDSYIKLFKKGEAKEAIPHLIMIADEFAELKNDQPEFMTELVSAARIGRSLGVHLILATQKPAGVVDDQIWSNSKFKLCLKVQDAADSNEMIKTPLAANITEAGRAYFQVGNNEIFELFQSAWSGAKKYDDDDISKKEVEISEILIDGSRKVVYSSKNDEKKKEGKTQLDAVVDRINEIANVNGIKKLNGPWLPSLDEIMYLDDIVGVFDKSSWEVKEMDIKPIIGILDNPKMQIQKSLSINLSENGHTLIVGSPGVGKTTLLQTMITSLAVTYSPEVINIYIMDFGSRMLTMYGKIPHVGGVITMEDEVLTKNFINFIHKEILKRKKILSESGVSNVISYKEVTGEILPQIIIIVDNYAAFTEIYEDYEEDITKFSRDGANLGIYLVITISNSSDIRYKISSNFKNNIVLNCVDNGEYGNVFGRIDIEPAKNAGRGLIKDDDVCEFQTALSIKAYSEGERVAKIKQLISDINNDWTGKRAIPIPMIPDNLSACKFVEGLSDINGFEKLYVGIDINEIESVSININNMHFIPVVGKASSGKSNTLKALAYCIEKTCIDEKYDIYVCDSSDYGLVDIENKVTTQFYSNNKDEIIQNLLVFKDELEQRKYFIQDEICNSRGKVREQDLVKKFSKKIIIIDNIFELLESIEDEYDIIDMFKDIIESKHGYGFVIIAASNEENFNDLSYNNTFMNVVKKRNQGILLQDIEEQDYFNVKVNYGSKDKSIKVGYGYLIVNGEYKIIKIPFVS
ncbi:type VII secretion protein EssC [Clostridium gasigenes]|uniref:Type VII secretion protein EssC n=1 Tax=Clostridium gasigenes TaxID=94869 RepID=A0A7X0SFI5_9CLOT|nr:type VII secretion protein EssC [Clostridium gasigenes]MBB6716652.1 type VII secretion protein EssC [Clostridium gasigenes]